MAIETYDPKKQTRKGIVKSAQGNVARQQAIAASPSFNALIWSQWQSGQLDRRLLAKHIPTFKESQHKKTNQITYYSHDEVMAMSPQALNAIVQHNGATADAMDYVAMNNGLEGGQDGGKWHKTDSYATQGMPAAPVVLGMVQRPHWNDYDKNVANTVNIWLAQGNDNNPKYGTGAARRTAQSLINTGQSGSDTTIPGQRTYDYLQQYQWIKAHPTQSTGYIQQQYKQDLKNRQPGLLEQIYLGGMLAAGGAALAVPVGAGLGLASGMASNAGMSTVSAILGSNTAAGAATGALTSAAIGADPLKGALMGGAAGAVSDFTNLKGLPKRGAQALAGKAAGGLVPQSSPSLVQSAQTTTPANTNPTAGIFNFKPTFSAPKIPDFNTPSRGLVSTAQAKSGYFSPPKIPQFR